MANQIQTIAFLAKGESMPDFGDEYKVSFGNRKFFDKPRPKYKAVYSPSFPEVEEAYRKAGAEVLRVDAEPSVEDPAQDNLQEPEKPSDDVSEDWRNLSWPKMRGLANKFSEEPVKSKAEAVEVLEGAEEEGKL